MIDLNQILLFIACVSPLVLLARTARRSPMHRGFRWAAVVVLAMTALAFWIAPAGAGFVGGSAWLLLLLLPSIGLRKAAELSTREQFRDARRLVRLLQSLHPTKMVREERQLLSALEMAQAGDAPGALEILTRLACSDTPVGKRAQAHLFRIRGDWEGLLAWTRANLPRAGVGADPALLLLYFRALGELGLREELVIQFAGRAPVLQSSPIYAATFASGLLTVLAFCGRTAALRQLLSTALRGMPKAAKQSWLGKSELATPAPVSAPNETTVARFAREVETGRGYSLTRRRFPTPAVLAIIILNLAMFGAEIALGGSTNSVALHRLGALEPANIIAAGAYWRLLAALFLHYGALHMTVNLYALYVLGPALEATIGAFRFALAYLLSGLGSSAGVVALWRLGWTEADFLVGASGAVMGIVGTWVGLLARHRHLPMARRRLINLGMIVLIQTAFDLYMPQISIAAHLCGLTSGVLLGLVVAPARMRRSYTYS